MLGVGAEGSEEIVVVKIARCIDLVLPASVIAIVTLYPTGLALTGHLKDLPGKFVDGAEHNGEDNATVLPLKIRLLALGTLNEANDVLFEAPDLDPPLAKLWQSFSNFYANFLLVHASSMVKH